MKIKVTYLFNAYRSEIEKEISDGKNHDGHFCGMYRLREMGFYTQYVELEQLIPRKATVFIRKFIGTYYIHLIQFPKIIKSDIVFSSTAFSSLFLKGLLGFKRSKWIVLDFGLAGMIGEAKTWKQKFLKKALGYADGIITLSSGEKEVMKKMFPDKVPYIEFIPYGIDIEYFKPHTGFSGGDFILSPCRDSGRDLGTLFLATKNIGVKTVITARDSTIARAGGLPGHVSWESFTPKKIVEEYSKSLAVVIPLSLSENINNAMGLSTLVEAMAMGKAIIATNTETMRSYITDGLNGLLVPEGDAKSMSFAIQRVVSDESLRDHLGGEARRFVEERCDANMWAKSLADYFKKVIKTS